MTQRILHILPTLDAYGTAKQLTLLATQLPGDQFDVHVCALASGGPRETNLRQADIPTRILGQRWSLDPLTFWQLERHVRRLRPDVVHTWLPTGNAYGRAAALAAGAKRLVACERSTDPWNAPRHLALDRNLAMRTRAIVVNAPGVREAGIARGLPAEKIVEIGNCVAPLGPSPTSREALLAELGLPADTRLAGILGPLVPQKRVKDAIWATDLLRCLRWDTHLLVLGDGPQRWQLERFARLCTVDSHVHFLGQREDVDRYLPHFDFVWHPSHYEGQPNAVMEALAAGVPVIGADVPGTRELVVSGENGYLVPVGDRAAQARFANKLLDDVALRERLGRAGRERMTRDFAIGTMIERYTELYRRLAD